jgi:RNA polymerase sigma factor (sigma-70 family)
MMPTSQMSRVLQQLRGATLRRDGASLTDAQLLGYFLERRDEAAFAALVYRHGPMVWGVCRRVLRNHHEAEDAFQATFLVLVHKAASVVPRQMVGNWLYGVARQTAVRARAAAAKRHFRERQAMAMSDPTTEAPDLWDDLELLLDEELSRLPDKYRAPVVLCDLEGKSRREAAAQLGWREGTVSGRLARARAMLARRLVRRGLTVSGGALAALLVGNAATASAPASAVTSTIRSAALVAAGRSAAALPPAVADLTRGVLKAMFLTRLKIATTVLLFVVLACYGVSVQIQGAPGGERTAGDKRGTAADEVKARQQPTPGATMRGGSSRVLLECKSPVLGLAWSAKGDRVAAGTQDGTVHVAESATGKEVHSFPVSGSVAALAFSPDAKRLAVSRPGQSIGTWDVATGKETFFGGSVRVGTTVEHLAFLPGGQSVAGVGLGCFVQFGGGGSGASAMAPAGGCSAVAPDGLLSGWCDTTGLVRYRPSSRGGQIALGNPLTLQVGNARSIAFANGGKLLVVGGADKGVAIWDLEANKQMRTLTGLEKPASQLSFSADGKALAALTDDGTTVRIWDFARGTTRCRIKHHSGSVGTMALSPDGKTLATAVKDGKTVFLWNATPRQLTHAGPPLELSAKELAAFWDELAGNDAEKADAAWLKLGAAGDNAVPFLRRQLRQVAVPPADVKALEILVADLDSPKFTTREQAAKKLEAAGELAVVPLQRCLEKKPTVEVERRANLILKKIGEPVLTPERLRVLEALDLLEQVSSAKALALLEEIERDALIPSIRIEAGRALRRVAQMSKEKK